MRLILQNQTNNHTNQEVTQEVTQKIFQEVLDRLLTCNFLPREEFQPEKLKNMTVELLLTNDSKIQALNKQYRQKDEPTDVLSFPTGKFPNADPLPQGNNSLGQIIISLETATRQAPEQGHSLEHELKFLFAHGLLHLLGYDHQTPEDEKIMFAKTDELLT